MSGKAESFHELVVYQEACALDLAIFQLTKAWPKEEMYSLTDQIRRSSRSVAKRKPGGRFSKISRVAYRQQGMAEGYQTVKHRVPVFPLPS